MKVALGTVLRSAFKSTLGLVVVGGLITGCGEDSTNPEAVDLTELKYPFGLSIQDQGGGTVRLSWSGMNNEDDFSGYNIYGVKGDTDISGKKGDTIQLLTSDGEQDAAGKELLQKMSYNGSDWETVGEADADLDAEFQIVPYHTATDADGNAILPTCRPSGTGEACGALSADDSIPDNYAFNGTTFIDLSLDAMGATYCFTVASTLDEGSKISFTTSEVRCVVPRAEVEISATAEQGKAFQMDFAALRESCDGKGTCTGTALGTDTEINTDGTAVAFQDDGIGLETLATCSATTPVVACLENFGATDQNGDPLRNINFTAAATGAVQDLGYYPGGFADPTFVPASKLVWDDDQLIHDGGYSLKGQSMPIADNHIYVVAEPKDDANSDFFYHYVYVTEVPASSTSMEFKMTVRVAETAGDR